MTDLPVETSSTVISSRGRLVGALPLQRRRGEGTDQTTDRAMGTQPGARVVT